MTQIDTTPGSDLTGSTDPGRRKLHEPPVRKPGGKPGPGVPSTQPSGPNSTGLIYAPYPSTAEWAYSGASPASQPVSKGYDVVAPRTRGQRRSVAISHSNATLTDGAGSGSAQMSIFVNAVGIDTALSGSYGQSRMTRDFYARNFTQPSFIVRGQSLDQEDYGLLCEFIHNAQHKALTNGYSNLTQLYIMGRDRKRGVDGTQTSGRAVTLSQPGAVMKQHTSDPGNASSGKYYNQGIRGSHQPFLAKGYVSSMPRGHRRGEYAVVWQFNFVVTAMLAGIYTEEVAYVKKEKTWMDILADSKAAGVINVSSLQATNKAALAYAAANTTAAFGNPTLPTQPPPMQILGGGASSGSGASASTSGGSAPTVSGSYNKQQLMQLWTSQGGNSGAASIAAAVALAESSGNPNSNLVSSVEDSRGLWQINTFAHPGLGNLYDPATNAKAAIQISGNGSNWGPWSTFTSGAYKKFL